MTATKEEVIAAIDSELAYQDFVWPESGPNGDGVLSIGERILLIEEYAAKARAAWSTESAPEMGALDIMRKITTIGFRCMAEHGAVNRKVS
jgi:hypothetical protein